MEWHDGACRRLDLASIDGIESCRGCGSFKQLPPARLQPARLQPARLPPISPNDQRKKIRLLCLLPDSFVEDIKCEISVCNIDAKPKYDAISYTWADDTGSSDKIKTISISGKPFKVTHNCELALKRARYFSSPRTIWVDAVCIDQDNDQERGHQVELMPRIYSTARHVLAYVGEDKDKSGWLVQVLLMSRQDRDPDTFQRAICSFFERPYFRRAWVLQEIALAREPFLVCGNMSISWRDFVRRCSSSISKPPAVLMFNFETYTRPRQFLPLLDLARRCYASDPRDKVFALLGLAADASQSIESDYTHDVVHVYTKVAIYLASVYDWMDVLCRAGGKYHTIPGLPSWVPDWSYLGEESFEDLNEKLERAKKSVKCNLRGHSLELTAFQLYNFKEVASDGNQHDLIKLCVGNISPLAYSSDGRERSRMYASRRERSPTYFNRGERFRMYSGRRGSSPTYSGRRGSSPTYSGRREPSEYEAGFAESDPLCKVLGINRIDSYEQSSFAMELTLTCNNTPLEDSSLNYYPSSYSLLCSELADRKLVMIYFDDLLTHFRSSTREGLLSFFCALLPAYRSVADKAMIAEFPNLVKYNENLVKRNNNHVKYNEKIDPNVPSNFFQEVSALIEGVSQEVSVMLERVREQLAEFPVADESVESLWVEFHRGELNWVDYGWEELIWEEARVTKMRRLRGRVDKNVRATVIELYDAIWRLVVRKCLIREVTIVVE